MRKLNTAYRLTAIAAFLGCALMSLAVDAQTQSTTTTTTTTTTKAKAAPADKDIVASAMTAAPAKVAQGATVVAMGADGSMRTVRKGTNGFTCMADNPETPGPDPMCADQNAMEWIHAWVGKKTPSSG